MSIKQTSEKALGIEEHILSSVDLVSIPGLDVCVTLVENSYFIVKNTLACAQAQKVSYSPVWGI